MVTRDQELASRTRATIDDLCAQVAKLEAQLADARADFDALEDAAAAVVLEYEVGGYRLAEAIEAMRDGGFDGWWEKTGAPREPPSIALRTLLATAEVEVSALRRSARAMYGVDRDALQGLAPEAMRAVLTKRGWHLDSKAMWYADRSVVAAEVWEHPTARATKPGQPWLKRVEVLVLPDAADKATRVAEWAEAVASRHGDVSAVEVLAEALLEAAQGGV